MDCGTFTNVYSPDGWYVKIFTSDVEGRERAGLEGMRGPGQGFLDQYRARQRRRKRLNEDAENIGTETNQVLESFSLI